MKRITIIIIDGKEVEFEKIPAEKRQEIVNELNRRALGALGYYPVERSSTKEG